MHKNLYLELAVPVGFILLPALALWETRNLSALESAFPRLISGIMLVAAVALLAVTLIKKQVVVSTEGMRLGKVLMVILALALYIVLLPIAGYILCSIALGGFLIFVLGYRRIPLIAISCTVFTAVVFFAFRVLLSVPLPTPFLNF